MDHTRVGVLYAEMLGLQTRTTVENVYSKKKIGMDALKLLILERRKQIYFMNEKNMGLKKDSMSSLSFQRSLFLSSKFLLP